MHRLDRCLHMLVLVALGMMIVSPVAHARASLTHGGGQARSMQSQAGLLVGAHTTKDVVATGHASAMYAAQYTRGLRSFSGTRILLKERITPEMTTSKFPPAPVQPDGTADPNPSQTEVSEDGATPPGPDPTFLHWQLPDFVDDSNKSVPKDRPIQEDEPVVPEAIAGSASPQGTVEPAVEYHVEHQGAVQLHFQMPRPEEMDSTGADEET